MGILLMPPVSNTGTDAEEEMGAPVIEPEQSERCNRSPLYEKVTGTDSLRAVFYQSGNLKGRYTKAQRGYVFFLVEKFGCEATAKILIIRKETVQRLFQKAASENGRSHSKRALLPEKPRTKSEEHYM